MMFPGNVASFGAQPSQVNVFEVNQRNFLKRKLQIIFQGVVITLVKL
jgi:hypothetical protein